LPGSEIVSHIEKQAREIDERIVSDARKNGLLEAIDLSHPGVIESYHSPSIMPREQKIMNTRI